MKSHVLKTSHLLVALAAFVSGCASTSNAPPSNVTNACSILDEKARWEGPIFNSARDWGVSPGTILAFMRQESSFRHNAQPLDAQGNPRSSALGYSQALDGTWADYERARGAGKRKRFDDAADFIGWYLDVIARQTSIAKTDPRALYLAYHEGPSGYRRGTYAQKPWLQTVAARVASQAAIYDGQLHRCERTNMARVTSVAALPGRTSMPVR